MVGCSSCAAWRLLKHTTTTDFHTILDFYMCDIIQLWPWWLYYGRLEELRPRISHSVVGAWVLQGTCLPPDSGGLRPCTLWLYENGEGQDASPDVAVSLRSAPLWHRRWKVPSVRGRKLQPPMGVCATVTSPISCSAVFTAIFRRGQMPGNEGRHVARCAQAAAWPKGHSRVQVCRIPCVT